MKPTLVTETSEVKTQTPGKFPEESTLILNSSFNLIRRQQRIVYDRYYLSVIRKTIENRFSANKKNVFEIHLLIRLFPFGKKHGLF
jgi:hypothetical protein